ncbi:hypothetical protein HKL94_02050 [Candidatus Parcubacteria bacterium]|nr:hypothetical protein [Candidatus Parcubacteria bacterium]
MKKAQFEDNRAALSAMGRKGAKEAAVTRAQRREEKERTLLEIKLANARLGKETDEGDIQPPDPEVVHALEDELRSREEH